jgi:hypothetical protein
VEFTAREELARLRNLLDGNWHGLQQVRAKRAEIYARREEFRTRAVMDKAESLYHRTNDDGSSASSAGHSSQPGSPASVYSGEAMGGGGSYSGERGWVDGATGTGGSGRSVVEGPALVTESLSLHPPPPPHHHHHHHHPHHYAPHPHHYHGHSPLHHYHSHAMEGHHHSDFGSAGGVLSSPPPPPPPKHLQGAAAFSIKSPPPPPPPRPAPAPAAPAAPPAPVSASAQSARVEELVHALMTKLNLGSPRAPPAAAPAAAPAPSSSSSPPARPAVTAAAPVTQRPPPSMEQLVADLVRAGELAKAREVLVGAAGAGLLGDTWETLPEADKVARELECWAWSWDAEDNLRFVWAEPPSMSSARVAWREDFYKHWGWTFEGGSLRLSRTKPGGRSEWDSLPSFFPAPKTQRGPGN